MKSLTAIGLMSGTSLDGVDCALLRTDGRAAIATGPALTMPYDDAFRERLRSALGRCERMPALERELTERHAAAVNELLEMTRLPAADIDVVGFHGQTLFHRPKEGVTYQIGDGALLARLVGIPVVNDFRSRDVAAGGQGAPLVPVFHAALCAGMDKPVAVLNIGGVANLTWVDEPKSKESDAAMLAFDTGPGNALIDDWTLRATGAAVDLGGRLAASGTVDARVLDRLIAHPFFGQKPPKSLDRNDFRRHAEEALKDLSPADGAATLTEFTAAAVAASAAHLPKPPKRWLVCGGGRHNAALMAALARHLKQPVAPVEDAGWRGDHLEAEAFAYLAVRSVNDLPLTFPSTTGVAQPMTGGRLHATPNGAGTRWRRGRASSTI